MTEAAQQQPSTSAEPISPQGSAEAADEEAGASQQQGKGGKPSGGTQFTEQARNYLESVYVVTPYPEEYVKYRLHLATGLDVKQISTWFHNRRQREKRQGVQLQLAPPNGDEAGAAAAKQLMQLPPLPITRARPTEPSEDATTIADFASAIGVPPPSLPRYMQTGLPPLPQPEDARQRQGQPPVARPQPMSLSLVQSLERVISASSSGLPAGAGAATPSIADSLGPLMTASASALGAAFPSFGGGVVITEESTEQPHRGAANGSAAAPAAAVPPQTLNPRNLERPAVGGAAGRGLAAPSMPLNGDQVQFCEEDLSAVSQLVGLSTITAASELAGSHTLYLFEQLTHLDTLTPEAPAAKRRRTRHQHFWRNSDKFPKEDRVYVASKNIKPALEQGDPVPHVADLAPEQRTNLWTVCLTARGVVNYLNRKISPLGVRLFRTLLQQLHHQQQEQQGSTAQQLPRRPHAAGGASGAGFS